MIRQLQFESKCYSRYLFVRAFEILDLEVIEIKPRNEEYQDILYMHPLFCYVRCTEDEIVNLEISTNK